MILKSESDKLVIETMMDVTQLPALQAAITNAIYMLGASHEGGLFGDDVQILSSFLESTFLTEDQMFNLDTQLPKIKTTCQK